MVLAYPCWNFSETALHKVCICESCRNMDCHLVIYGGILRKWNVLFTVCPDRPQRVTQVRQQISYIPNSFQVVRDPELHNALPLQLKQSKYLLSYPPSLFLLSVFLFVNGARFNSTCEWTYPRFWWIYGTNLFYMRYKWTYSLFFPVTNVTYILPINLSHFFRVALFFRVTDFQYELKKQMCVVSFKDYLITTKMVT